jgi:hypothetical protein
MKLRNTCAGLLVLTLLCPLAVRAAEEILQYRDGDRWRDAIADDARGQEHWRAHFPAVTATKVRLLVVAVHGTHPQFDTPSVYELEIYDTH